MKLELQNMSFYEEKNTRQEVLQEIFENITNKYLEAIDVCMDKVYLDSSIEKNLNYLLIECCFLEKNLKNSLNNI